MFKSDFNCKNVCSNENFAYTMRQVLHSSSGGDGSCCAEQLHWPSPPYIFRPLWILRFIYETPKT